MFEELLDSSELLQAMARRSLKNHTLVVVSEKEAVEMLMGQVDLSQRGHNNLRDILNKANVQLPRYQDVMKHEETLQIGEVC